MLGLSDSVRAPVVGVDRLGQAGALRRNGADVVVRDLGELPDA
jgi:phosphoglycolate phosphatase-like HAD superfamily hydrolase